MAYLIAVRCQSLTNIAIAPVVFGFQFVAYRASGGETPRPARARGLLLIRCSEGLSWLKRHCGWAGQRGYAAGEACVAIALPAAWVKAHQSCQAATFHQPEIQEYLKKK